MSAIEYDESMLEEDKINRFLNMIATQYDGKLARDFQTLYIKKEKEIDKYKEILDKIKEKCKEEKEVHFNNGTIINGLAIYILELLEEIDE